MPRTLKNINHEQQHIKCFKSLLNDSKKIFPEDLEQTIIIVCIATQQLYLVANYNIIKSYVISSAEFGVGNQSGSHQTPLGAHRIAEKIGENTAIATIFKARQNTHSTAKILTLSNEKSDADNITSRILWLAGLEEGINKGFDQYGNNIDSHSRYIYIHGTDEESRLGKAVSHGCIRMANRAVIELFNKVNTGCLVLITES